MLCTLKLGTNYPVGELARALLALSCGRLRQMLLLSEL